MEMEVIRPGSSVSIQGQNDIKVLAVHITQSGISYECGWWNERTYNSRYFDAAQVVLCDGDKMPVGYE